MDKIGAGIGASIETGSGFDSGFVSKDDSSIISVDTGVSSGGFGNTWVFLLLGVAIA